MVADIFNAYGMMGNFGIHRSVKYSYRMVSGKFDYRKAPLAYNHNKYVEKERWYSSY